MDARLFRLILLAAALFLAQLGGLAHGIGHFSGGDQDEPHAACELCAAYAAFDHGAATSPLAIPRLACRIPHVETRAGGVLRRVFLAFHSRAPPVSV